MIDFDELWPGGPRFAAPEGSFKLSTDSVLLADFVSRLRAKKIIDLGCGAGVLPVLLNISHPQSSIHGIEIQPEQARLCRDNLGENGFDAGGIIEGDVRDHRRLFKAGEFDLVVSNPPYFAAGSGLTAPEEGRATARDERCLSLAQLCEAAKYLCRWGGAFALVHRPERLSEIFCAMSSAGIEPKRLRTVHYKSGYAPNLVLIEGRRGGKPGLSFEKPLVLCTGDGEDTEEIKTIYHRG